MHWFSLRPGRCRESTGGKTHIMPSSNSCFGGQENVISLVEFGRKKTTSHIQSGLLAKTVRRSLSHVVVEMGFWRMGGGFRVCAF